MSKEDFIPAGFVPLANWDYRSRGKADGHSHSYKVLRIAADAGKVPAIQVGGSNRWYVREADAAAFLKCEANEAQASANSPRKEQVADVAATALTEVLSAMVTNQFTLIHAIEQIADAVQRIANQQPLARMDDVAACETSGAWRDMSGESL